MALWQERTARAGLFGDDGRHRRCIDDTAMDDASSSYDTLYGRRHRRRFFAESFAGEEDDTGSSNTADFAITPATATITVTGFSGGYDGEPHGVVSSSATGAGGATIAGLSVDGTTYTDARAAWWTGASATRTTPARTARPRSRSARWARR